MFNMTKMPKTLEAMPGKYAVVRVEATVDRTEDLNTLGKDIATDCGINRPSIQILSLVERGNVYLIVVTKRD